MKKLATMLALIVSGLLAAGLPAVSAAAPTCVAGAPGVAPTATIAWNAVTLNTDGSAVAAPVTYDIYMGSASGSETLLKAGVTSPTTISAGLGAGGTYYWYVIVKDALGTASAPSAEVCKSFPKAVPGTVTITIT